MPGMTPTDLYELTAVSDPRVSPDGTTVAYVVTTIDREGNDYRSAIWLAALDGSSPPRRFTTDEHKNGSPRWSPDGTRLAFTSARGGPKDPAQLYVIPVAGGGEAIKLTSLPESARAPVWSPDGTRIAFLARVRDDAYDEQDDRKRAPRRFTRLQFKLDNEGWIGDRRSHLFVVAADGTGEAEQLTDGDFEDGPPCWSPDGTSLAFTSARDPDWDILDGNDVYVVDARGGELRRLTRGDGSYSLPSWSPDGATIAVGWSPAENFDFPHHTQIAAIEVSSGERRVLTTSLDRNCSPYPAMREPIWHGDRILFAFEDDGNIPLAMVPADGSSEPTAVLRGEFGLNGYDMAGGQGVHVATTPTALPELFYGDKQLTEHGAPFAAGRTLAPTERFTARSADGSEVSAWIVRPPDFDPARRYPTLLSIHGGPFTQYGNRFFDEFQVYAGAGYVVLFSNPRGSSGYSEAFGRAIRGPAGEAGPGWGTRDYEDLMGVIDTALERFDFIDPARLGVLGGSYGGFMTSWIVSHTDRFASAISERAVNDWVSMYGSSDYGWVFRGSIGADIAENFDAWRAMSPVTYADRINTPLLIMHSENDLRCNVEQAEQLFTRLRLARKQVEMVRFPAESHELSRSGSPAHRVMRFEAILEWFERTL